MRRRQLALSATCLLPFVLAACGNDHTPDPRTAAPVVGIAPVAKAPAATLSFTGSVGARVVSNLGFRVSGKVLQRLVDTGQVVTRGQVLMRIDPVDLRLDAHAQSQSVAAARARTKQTADDEARYRGLVAAGAVSASAYDQIKTAADSARAQLAAAQAQADVSKNAASYAVLQADADGVVVDTQAEPGQVVSAGQVVVRLAHAGPREAIVDLPETLRPAIGSRAEAALYGQDQAVSARLRQLSDAADPLTRTYEARYVLEGALAKAPLGATVTIGIPDSESSAQDGMQVPIGAIFNPGKGTGVWVVAGHPDHVAWRSVRVLGLSDDAARVVGTNQGDLKVGDQVVALGAQLLHEGEEVKPAPLATRTAAIVEHGGLLK